MTGLEMDLPTFVPKKPVSWKLFLRKTLYRQLLKPESKSHKDIYYLTVGLLWDNPCDENKNSYAHRKEETAAALAAISYSLIRVPTCRKGVPGLPR